MNKPVSAKCYSRILNDLEQISPKMRRSRKLSWKKGGVDCEVSRCERDFPDTFTPTIDHLPLRTSAIPLEPDQFNTENSANEKRPESRKDLAQIFQQIFSPEIFFFLSRLIL